MEKILHSIFMLVNVTQFDFKFIFFIIITIIKNQSRAKPKR